MRLLVRHRADALLQREERFVDLRTLHARPAIRVVRIRAALGAREVDECELSEQRLRPSPVLSNQDLEDTVRARRARVRRRRALPPQRVARLDCAEEACLLLHLKLREAAHLVKKQGQQTRGGY